MDLIKNQWVGITALVIAVAVYFMAGGDTTIIQSPAQGGTTNFDAISVEDLTASDDVTVGDDLTVTDDFDVAGDVTFDLNTQTLAPTSIYSTTTLTAANSGMTYMVSASGTLITLPAATDGVQLRFVTAAAKDTGSTTIDSAEGDNIHGTLNVNNADVDCSGEDQININPDLETLGDYVELYSDGTSWFIGDSVFGTAASVTCTDPS